MRDTGHESMHLVGIMSDVKQIRVTVEDLESGDKETVEISDDYVLICAGSAYQDGVQAYPTKGTHVITIKGLKR